MEDQTQLDAPVTPAPVFAYRALKAVLWGEEKTPEQSSTKRLLILEKDTKHESYAHMCKTGPSLGLSPNARSRRKILSQPSPTKSILRTPGAHTPRRAMLRDTNVTFKDIRKSISPEILQKGMRTQLAADLAPRCDKENIPFDSLSQENNVILDIEVHAASEPHPNVSTIAQQVPSNLRSTALSLELPSTINNDDMIFDAESYMRMTEKEMKKLIKYGQKMREYARRKDEENDKLRGLLKEVRLENEHLRKQIARSKKETVEEHETRSFAKREKDHVKTEAVRKFNDNKDRERSRNEKYDPKLYTTEAYSQSQTRPESRLESQTTTATATTTVTNKRSRSTNSYPYTHNTQHTETSPKRAKHETSRNPRTSSQQAPFQIHHEPEEKSSDRHSTPFLKSEQEQKQKPNPDSGAVLNLPLRPTTTNTNTNNINTSTSTTIKHLPADRIAAARARIRKKEELRKASAGSDGIENRVLLPLPLSKSTTMESSAVDWDWHDL